MTSLSNIEPYIQSIGYDLFELDAHYRQGLNYELADEQRAVTNFAASVMRQITAIVQAATGDADYLTSYEEKITDDIRACFQDAIEGRDDERDNQPVSRRAPYGIAVDRARM